MMPYIHIENVNRNAVKIYASRHTVCLLAYIYTAFRFTLSILWAIIRYNSLGILTIFGPSSIFLIYMSLGVKKYKENFELTKKIKFSRFKRFFGGFCVFLAVFALFSTVSRSLPQIFFGHS